MRYRTSIRGGCLWLALGGMLAGGCGPGVSDAELGRVLDEETPLPGQGQPYPLPDLDTPGPGEPPLPEPGAEPPP